MLEETARNVATSTSRRCDSHRPAASAALWPKPRTDVVENELQKNKILPLGTIDLAGILKRKTRTD